MSCKSSQYSLSLAKADASAKVTNAKIEMEFLDKETALKQYALAKAEENAFKEALDEQLELDSQVKEPVKIESIDARPETNLSRTCHDRFCKTGGEGGQHPFHSNFSSTR